MTREPTNRAQVGSGAEEPVTGDQEESLSPHAVGARLWSTQSEHTPSEHAVNAPNVQFVSHGSVRLTSCDARRSTHGYAVAFSLGIVAPMPAILLRGRSWGPAVLPGVRHETHPAHRLAVDRGRDLPRRFRRR